MMAPVQGNGQVMVLILAAVNDPHVGPNGYEAAFLNKKAAFELG